MNSNVNDDSEWATESEDDDFSASDDYYDDYDDDYYSDENEDYSFGMFALGLLAQFAENNAYNQNPEQDSDESDSGPDDFNLPELVWNIFNDLKYIFQFCHNI